MPAWPNDSLYISLTKSAVVTKTTLLPGVTLVHALLMCDDVPGKAVSMCF